MKKRKKKGKSRLIFALKADDLKKVARFPTSPPLLEKLMLAFKVPNHSQVFPIQLFKLYYQEFCTAL